MANGHQEEAKALLRGHWLNSSNLQSFPVTQRNQTNFKLKRPGHLRRRVGLGHKTTGPSATRFPSPTSCQAPPPSKPQIGAAPDPQGRLTAEATDGRVGLVGWGGGEG